MEEGDPGLWGRGYSGFRTSCNTPNSTREMRTRRKLRSLCACVVLTCSWEVGGMMQPTQPPKTTVVTVPGAQQPVVSTGRRSVVLQVLGSSNTAQSTSSSEVCVKGLG